VYTHQFAVTITLLKAAQIILLIPVTTVSVESGFSIVNKIKDEKESSLNEKTLNMKMMIKSNINEKNLNSIFFSAAKKWYISKKRRNNATFLHFLNLRKAKWNESKNNGWTEKETDENEENEENEESENFYSGLNLSLFTEKKDELEKELEKELDENCLDEEVLEDEKNLKKIKANKKVKRKRKPEKDGDYKPKPRMLMKNAKK
jgi:hypothetical protein